MDIVAFLLEYHNPCVNQTLKKVNIVNTLERLDIDLGREDISIKRDRLIDYLRK